LFYAFVLFLFGFSSTYTAVPYQQQQAETIKQIPGRKKKQVSFIIFQVATGLSTQIPNKSF